MTVRLAVLFLWIGATPALTQTYQVKREVEGPYSFSLLGVELNKGSSLQRESVLFNDPSCPVQVSKNGMTFGYKDRRIQIASATEASITQPVTALEVRHILFDVLGRHMRNLANLEVKDFPAGTTALTGTWNLLDENATSELLTTVTYVARARLSDGTQWVVKSENLATALGTLHLEKKIGDEKPSKAPD